MKPIPAIVEPAQVDVDLCEKQILVALAGERDAESSAKRHQQQADAARATAKARRLDIGRLLCKARGAWPERGPNAKGWGEFLKRVGIDDSTAHRYIAEYRDPEGFAQKQRPLSEKSEPGGDEDDDMGPRIHPIAGPADPAPFRQLSEADLIQALGRLDPDARKRVLKSDRANVKGGSGDDERGTWCTSAEWARAVGPWEIDPFSNPRSHIAAVRRCMLENGGDGLLDPAVPGSYSAPPAFGRADELTRVWLQPPYAKGFVERVVAHYKHTRFCALLRWSPDTAWFGELWPLVAVVCHPFGGRMEFEPPPGVPKSGDMPFPHALYYAHEADVTDEVRARCIVWRIDHTLDCARQPALHIVR